MDFAFEPLAAGDNIFYFFTVTGIFYFDLFLAFVQLYFLGEKKEIQHCRCTGQVVNRKQRAHLRLFQEGY